MTKKTKSLIQRAAGIVCLGGIMFSATLFSSCSENDSTIEEYAEWQTKNETYWNRLYTATQQKIKEGDNSWKIILNYSFQNQQPSSGSSLTYRPEDYVIVHVEQTGTGTTNPLFSDSVSVHYMGRLIPSATYTSGLIFDKSWSSDTFSASTSRPAHFSLQDVVDGFSSAMQQMRKGDHWTVYIPYQLGYGIAAKGLIPGYSTLIFDLRMVDISHPGRKLKDA